MIQEIKHDLLESSKQLKNNKLSKTMIFKHEYFFSIYHLPYVAFSVSNQTSTNLFEHKTLQQVQHWNKRVLSNTKELTTLIRDAWKTRAKSIAVASQEYSTDISEE